MARTPAIQEDLDIDLRGWPTPLHCDPIWWDSSIAEPVAKGRPRFTVTGAGHVRAVTPERTRAAERLTRDFAAAMIRTPCERPVGVRLLFCLPHRRRVDVDNLAKLVLDAWNGVVFKDDSQIEELAVKVVRGADVGRWVGLVYDLGMEEEDQHSTQLAAVR